MVCILGVDTMSMKTFNYFRYTRFSWNSIAKRGFLNHLRQWCRNNKRKIFPSATLTSFEPLFENVYQDYISFGIGSRPTTLFDIIVSTDLQRHYYILNDRWYDKWCNRYHDKQTYKQIFDNTIRLYDIVAQAIKGDNYENVYEFIEEVYQNPMLRSSLKQMFGDVFIYLFEDSKVFHVHRHDINYDKINRQLDMLIDAIVNWPSHRVFKLVKW